VPSIGCNRLQLVLINMGPEWGQSDLVGHKMEKHRRFVTGKTFFINRFDLVDIGKAS
jgi:hypothetical protein